MALHRTSPHPPFHAAPAPWHMAGPAPRPRDIPRVMLTASGIAVLAAVPAGMLVSLITRIPGLQVISPALGMSAGILLPLGILGILASAPVVLLRRTPPGSNRRSVRRLRALAAVLLSLAVLVVGLFVFLFLLFLSQPIMF